MQLLRQRRAVVQHNMKTIIYISSVFCIAFLFGCKTTYDIKSENKNYEKAEKLFDSYFNENGSAFLYSVGTIGPKYVWTYADQKIILISIDISGKTGEKQIENIQDWTKESESTFNKIYCPMVLDGDILKIKFKNNKGDLFDQSLIYEFDCLKSKDHQVIKNTIEGMTILKIK